MSANSAVTVLRSPSAASGKLLSGATRTLETDPCGVEVTLAAPAPFVSGAPHLPQKSDVGGFSALHFAQCFAAGQPSLPTDQETFSTAMLSERGRGRGTKAETRRICFSSCS